MPKTVEVSRAEISGNFLCVATFLPLRRWRDVIPFLRMAARVERQLKQTTGLVRYGLRANLLRKRFWTFSVWAEQPSIASFRLAEPHATAMKRFEDWAGTGAAFVRWQSSDGSIDWSEAIERLKQADSSS